VFRHAGVESGTSEGQGLSVVPMLREDYQSPLSLSLFPQESGILGKEFDVPLISRVKKDRSAGIGLVHKGVVVQIPDVEGGVDQETEVIQRHLKLLDLVLEPGNLRIASRDQQGSQNC